MSYPTKTQQLEWLRAARDHANAVYHALTAGVPLLKEGELDEEQELVDQLVAKINARIKEVE